MKLLFFRFLRYGLVGALTNSAGYVVYLLITWWGVGPKIAFSLLYCVGTGLAYFGHRHIAFNFGGSYLSSGTKFIAAYAVGYGINFLLLYIFVDGFAYPHQLVQLVAIPVVAVFLFVCLNGLVFHTTSNANVSPRSGG